MDWDRDRSFRLDESRRRESYRPVDRPNRSPFRNRSPPRHGADFWVPPNGRPSGRPRSRSPASLRRSSRSPEFRGRDAGAGFPRARSPPRRFSPRREERQRSPSRSRRSRSPYGHSTLRSPRQSRVRSPPLKRGRESPAAYNARSPKRERIATPSRVRYDRTQSPPSGPRQMPYGLHRNGYHPSSRGPGRRDPPKDLYENSWRRRSPSNMRSIRYDHNSGQPHFKPRISPPPTRAWGFDSSHTIPRSRSPTQESSRQKEPPARSPNPCPKSPARISERYVCHSLPSQSTQRGRPSHRSPPTRHVTPAHQPQRLRGSVQHDKCLPASTQVATNGTQPTKLAPSNSPQVLRKPIAASTPTGPSATPISISGAQRAANLSLLSAPTRPKGGQAFKRDSPHEGSTSNISRRGPLPIHHNPPTGPRSNFSPVAAIHDQHRSRHLTAGPNPHSRTQRSTTNHLSGVTALVPGGKLLLSSLDPAAEKRLAQLETDKEKLLEQIVEKQKVKRAGLRDWDRLERESAIGALRSELADGHLQRMVEGDSIGGGVAF